MNIETIKTIVSPEMGVFWTPLLLLCLFIAIFLFFWLWGKKNFREDYNENTGQTQPYNSGSLDEVNYNIPSSHLYWGFKKSLQWYFNFIKKIHDGDLNNYAKWFLISIAGCFLVIGGGFL